MIINLLFITLLRTAELLFIPEHSPYLGCFLSMMIALFNKNQDIAIYYCYNLYTPLWQFMFCYLPITSINNTYWFLSMLYLSMAWVLWWTKYLHSRWKFLAVGGRTIAEVLKDPGRRIDVPSRDVYSTDGINTVINSDTEKENVRRDINKDFYNFHARWCFAINERSRRKVVINKCLQYYLGDCNQFYDALFWLYAGFIFLLNVFHYFSRYCISRSEM